MIPIVKLESPQILLEKGVPATKQFCEAYAAGSREFEFDQGIYGAEAVKETLKKAQHKKCAFCESFFAHIAFGDVEHFRPKAGFKQRETDKRLKRPGYYWLAYEWKNLFCSCQLCNQRFKRNLFPLKNARRRAYSHNHKLENEQPLLVDPSIQDPARFIGFREEIAYAVDGCPEGKATIEILGLNRDDLTELRRKRLQDLKYLIRLCELLAPDSQEFEDKHNALQTKTASAAEYAAMARAYLAGLKS